MQINKEDTWLEICEFTAQKLAKCVRRKYAAIIIADNGRVLGIGYNGAPPRIAHCDDGGCPRASLNVGHGTSYDNCIAVHAEANALLWTDIDMRQGATLIVNGPPCYSCAKLICGSGIKKVVCYMDYEYKNFDQVLDLFDKAGIQIRVKEKKCQI